LGSLHRLIDTQHQWRFEAVKKSDLFLTGAKTCYRAYSASKVVEMELMPKRQCVSRIGKLTGIETYTLVNTWQPEAYGINALPGREGWEGFYLLRYA